MTPKSGVYSMRWSNRRVKPLPQRPLPNWIASSEKPSRAFADRDGGSFVAARENDSYRFGGVVKEGCILRMTMSSQEWQFLKSSISRMEQIVSAMKELQTLSISDDAKKMKKIIARNLETGENLVRELRRKTAN
jgi:hypothetical protein